MTRLRLALTAASLGLLVAFWTATTACSGGDSGGCDVGCLKQATVDLQSTTGAWPPGTYDLTVTTDGGLDGGDGHCTLQVTDAPSPTAVALATCTGAVGLEFSSVAQCVMLYQDGASGGECRPVPGHFHETVTIAGTPSGATLSLALNGQPAIDAPVSFTYRPLQGCGCQQASAQLTVMFSAAGDAGTLTD